MPLKYILWRLVLEAKRSLAPIFRTTVLKDNCPSEDHQGRIK